MNVQGGNNNLPAGVSSKNRLFTGAEVFTPEEIGSFFQTPATFSWNSLAQTLTSTGASGILYVQNTDPDQNLLVRYINIGLGKSTGGNPGNVTAEIYVNAAALTGTLISAGTAVNGVCRNVGTASLAQATAWAGTEAKTITNGTVIETHMLKDQLFQQIPGAGLVLPANGAVAVRLTPGAGNTSIVVTVDIIGTYIYQTEVVQ